MTTGKEIRISTVVMHHPSRGPEISGLLAATAELVPRVVVDPDPRGPSSPLRTAKRAWAAIGDGATHHLVLQDDVEPCADFVEHLTHAVRARPEDVIALGVFSTSASNSYPVRLAAVAGEPWALLVPGEFVPAQGLLMPADQARDLARFLGGLPDELRDDDAFIDLFCRLEDLRVVATVPNLLEHVGDRSTADNDGHGIRRMAAFVPAWPTDARRWKAPPRVDKGAPMRAAGAGDIEFGVSVVAGRCIVRVVLATTDHPIRQPCVSWRHSTAITGVDVQAVVAAFARFGPRLVDSPFEAMGVPLQDVLEAWAAGFLLGADAGSATGQPLTELAVRGWFPANALRDVAEGDGSRAAEALTRVAVEAVENGRGYQRRGPLILPDVEPVVRALAEREARALALTTVAQPPPVALSVVECPTCGATESDARRAAAESPFGTVVVGGERDGAVPLRILACEVVSIGMLVVIAHLYERGLLPGEMRTRGIAHLVTGDLTTMEADERWFDGVARVDSGTLPVTADASSVQRGEWTAYPRAHVDAVVSAGPAQHVRADGYAEVRDAALRDVLLERNRTCPAGPRVLPPERYALLCHPNERGDRPLP